MTTLPRPSHTLLIVLLSSSTMLAGCQRSDQASGTTSTPTASTTGGDAANIRGSTVNVGSGGAEAAASAASGARP